jgi:DNA-binding transcriptional LysR family regulator
MRGAMLPIEQIQRRISLHDLRVLVAVVQAGSMGRAARRLATSQPAVSRSVSDLERALGVRLLDRGRHGVEPTSCGRALVARGLAIFDELAQGIGEIQFLSDPTSGQLRIGASIAVSVGFVAAVIDRLAAAHPRLTFDLLSTDTTSAFHALATRQVDLLVVHLVAPLADDVMHADVLFDDPHVVVAAAHSPWARRRRLRLADLRDEPWLLPRPDAPYGAIVCEAFRAEGLAMPRTVVSSTLPVRSVLLATGRYLSMIPRVALQFPVPGQTVRALPVDLPSTPRPLAIVTLKNRSLSPATQVFIDAARKAAGAVARKR